MNNGYVKLMEELKRIDRKEKLKNEIKEKEEKVKIGLKLIEEMNMGNIMGDYVDRLKVEIDVKKIELKKLEIEDLKEEIEMFLE